MSPVISDPRIACRIAMKLRTSFVHTHRTLVEHLSIQRSNCSLGFGRMCHFDKRDTTWLASIPILDDRDAFHGSVCCKNFPELLLCHRDVKVPDKNVGHEVILPLIFPNVSQLKTESESQKAISMEIAFSQRVGPLRLPVRSLLASPWGPWSRRTARFGPPVGS